MKTVLRFMKPYKGLCFFTLLVTILDVAGGLLIPRLTADMVNLGVAGGDLSYMLEKGGQMILIAFLAGTGALAGSYLCADLSAKIGRDMRNAVYDKSLEFSGEDFQRFGTGSMITRTLNDINVIQQAVVWCIQMVIPVPVVCIMGTSMAFAIDSQMGLLLIGVTVLIVVLALVVTRKASEIFDRLQRFLDRMNVVLRENITGVRVIRAFHKEKREEGRMRKTFEDYAESSIQANRLFAGLDVAAFTVINLCIVLILWLGGNRIGKGFMQIGDITALTEYAILILFYIIMAQMVIILLPRARVCSRRMEEVLKTEPEIRDSKDCVKGNWDNTQEVLRFEDVNFRFSDAEENTLKNISFSCRRGETTAIIGSTGSGKSTIARLILRFHDVSQGSILLKGQDLRNLPQKELRQEISYVPQKAWLFSGTIGENLAHGKENAGKEEMLHALEIAQADFVKNLPQGLETRVAQGGTNFSGGQKQRLCIARALMKDSDLYIFDDSFSALDFKTDKALREALKEETKEAAVLIIAQRISTILHASQIVVLDEGEIAGIGTHEYLMENCDVYRDIARSQMKGGE